MKNFIPYLETAVGFLNNRVSKSDVVDWVKLRMILRFVHYTFKEIRDFGTTNLNEIFKRVDEYSEIHHYMQSHTGCSLSMVLEVNHYRSSKHKFNTKSSIEAALIGASNYVSYNTWYIMFMHHHGYLNKLIIFPQQFKCNEVGGKWE